MWLETAMQFLPGFWIDRAELEQTARMIAQARAGMDARKFLPLSILCGAVAAVYCTSIFAILFPSGIEIAAPLAVVFFGLGFLLPKLWLKKARERRARLAESELPIVGRIFYVLLTAGATMEDAIAYIGKHGYYLSPEFGEASNAAAHGVPLQQALENLAESVDSMQMARFCQQLELAYETSSPGALEALLRLAEDMDGMAQIRLREFSGRLSFLSLAYIGASCILPAFALVLALFGGLFLKMEISGDAVFLGFVLAFPLLDLAVLLAILGQVPFSMGNADAGRARVREWLRAKFKLGLPGDASLFAIFILAGAMAFSLGGWAWAALAAMAAAAGYFLAAYCADSEVARMEEELPQALFHAAALYRSKSIDGVAEKLARGKNRPAEIFAKVGNAIAGGVAVERALENAAAETGSVFARQMLEILLIGHRAGSDLTNTLRAMALMVMGTLSLVKERRAVFALQRYTLFASLGIVVPVILASTYSLAGSLAQVAGGAGAAAGTVAGMQPGAAIFAVQAYLALASAVTAYFVAAAESQKAKAVLYFLGMFAPAMAIFTFGVSGGFF